VLRRSSRSIYRPRVSRGSRELKRIEHGLIMSVASAFIALFARLFSPTLK
jgi:hypothetical protein